MLDALQNLPPAALRSLAASLREGPLAIGLSRHALAQAIGPQAQAVHESLDGLIQQGMAPKQIAILAEAIAQCSERAAAPQSLFELVLSGPEVPGVPTADTAATIQTLIENAQTEIVLVGYAVHNGKKLFKRLAERLDATPTLHVVFCLDIARKQTDTSLASEIVRRFCHDFATKHWPGKRLPELYHDPRALSETTQARASLHAKCVIVDRRIAVVTSANFTEAAHTKNIEAGVLIRYEPFVQRLSDYFLALRNSNQLLRCPPC